MSKVSFGIRKYLDSSDGLQSGAIGEVIPVADVAGASLTAAERHARKPASFLVPVGDASVPVSVDLEAGSYLLRVSMPSGEAIEEQFEVGGHEEKSVFLDASGSVHEWLSWQHLAGNTRVRPSKVRIERSSAPDAELKLMSGKRSGASQNAPPSLTVRTAEGQRDFEYAFTSVESKPHADAGVQWLWEAVSPVADDLPNWMRLRDQVGAACESAVVGQSDFADERYDLFRTSPHDPRWQARTYPPWRNFMVVRSSTGIEVATLPLAWERIAPTPPWNVEVLVFKEARADTFVTRTSVVDESTSAMMGFMTRGRLDHARPFVEWARHMLFAKIFNPLGAAAGGYVLLANASAVAGSEWEGWTENLMQWFEWLPDGAILNGIRRLRTGRNDADFREAQRILLEGFSRGPPFFSMGVLLLQEGLMQLANEWGEPRVKQALATVNRTAAYLDTSQPFTTLRCDKEA
jgi:hypothetical protein